MFEFVKRVFNRLPYVQASAKLLAQTMFVPRPFRYDVAVNEFTGWVFAAATINSQTAASVPLRMYVKKRAGGEKLYRSKSVGERQRRYLAGGCKARPARRVLTKAADWGEDYEVLQEPHPALELLSRFNDWQCGFEVTQLRHLYQQLTGNAYVHVVTNRGTGQPSELFLMPPQWVEVVPAPRDSGELVAGYSYGVTRAEAKKFAPDEVIHFRYPNPNSLYYGMGRVEAGWPVVQLNDAQHVYDNATFQNSCRPDYAVILKSGQTQQQIDRFEAKFRKVMRDARDGGNFVSITGDVDLRPMQWPPKDMGGRDQVIEEISVVFGVPRDKLLGNATYANAENADSAWLRDTIHPMLTLDEEILNERYLPLWGIGDEAFLAYDNPVPEDEKAELEERKVSLAGNAWRTVNEIRAEDGLDEVDGGDVLPSAQAANVFNMPASSEPEPSGDSSATSGAVPVPEGGKVQDTAMTGVQITSLQDLLLQVTNGQQGPEVTRLVIQAAFPMLDEAMIAAMVVAADKFVPVEAKPEPPADVAPVAPVGRNGGARTEVLPKPDKGLSGLIISQKAYLRGMVSCTCHCLERGGKAAPDGPVARHASRIAGILAAQDRRVLAALAAVGKPKAVDADLYAAMSDAIKQALAESDPQLREAMRAIINDLMPAGGTAGNKRIGVTAAFDVRNPKVAEFADTYTPRLVRSLNTERARKIEDLVRQGLEVGKSGTELAHDIEESPSFTTDGIANRAEMISRTESARAYSEGEITAWEESGVVEGKRWALAPDACEFCEAAAQQFEGQTVGLRDAFYARGSQLAGTQGGVMVLDYSDIDGPPLHPNDRCYLEPVLETPK